MFLDPDKWPPPYTLTKTRRARHVRIKTSLKKGLELVVPFRFNKNEIPTILESHKDWITKQLAKLRKEFNEALESPLPEKIYLAAINQTWGITYIPSFSEKVSLVQRPQQQELVLLGNITNKWECKKRLNTWTRAHAKKFLTLQLQKVSQQTGLDFSDVSIRSQRSRWGSCSSDKRISLNYKLIFLPEPLCNHILIHELCHTIHLNHSDAFWDLVAKHDALWKEHNAATRKSEKFIPTWSKEF